MAENVSEDDKAVLKQMEDQSKTDSTLPEGTKIKPTDQEVKSDELMDTDGKLVSDPTNVVKPDDITAPDQTTPEKFDAAQYDATADTAEKIGTAKAAKGELSEGAIMEAAQGTVSPEALATAFLSM